MRASVLRFLRTPTAMGVHARATGQTASSGNVSKTLPRRE
jgi:hypothetical protein